MFALVALLYLHCAQTRCVAATIEHRFREVESVSGIVCPEEHTIFDALAPTAVVCATLCSSVGYGCRGVNFNLARHVCLGCNTSDLSSTASSEAQPGLEFLKKFGDGCRGVNFNLASHFCLGCNTSDLSSTASSEAEKSESIESNATMVDIIDVSTKDDDTKCRITGSALLPGDKLVLADLNNEKIKLLDLNTSEITSEIKVPDPWDVTSITEDQVAVTRYDAEKIAFITVTSVLKLDREIGVDGTCTGITYNNGVLFVAFNDPVKIEMMTLDGNVVRNIECSRVFTSPSHIVLSPTCDAVYVSDDIDFSVKRLGLDGEVEAEYEDEQLEDPSSVIVDQQGRVIVCAWGSDNIHLLTTDLTKIKLLVEGSDHPQSLSLWRNTGRLYVSLHGDNDLRVYQLP